jgi:carbonic anhydrase
MPESYKDLLDGNLHWVQQINKLRPEFFDDLSQGQHPKYLWIGCSDSRVPATEITETLPGSIFVQRNIANQVINTDSNLMSVVFYAVKVLKVKHIIVCGHYGCGGVQAAMSNDSFGYLDNWLVHLKNVYRIYQDELDGIKDEGERFARFVECNVEAQVNNLGMVSFIQELWQEGEFPYIHGWVYGLKDGIIKDLHISRNSADHLPKVFQYNPFKLA